MGNCIETPRSSPETDIINEEMEGKSESSSGNKKVRIKVVLTKEELEWLMIELRQTQGKKIEDVLEEIQRSRERSSVGWKPSLDCIAETTGEEMDT
ncbi:hypothetical protein SASPL_127400 [Salvia splendens]|uniref:Uncharacterized protein n=1 Tax=Salvia splendens TaxID=180675 RepID=A0A8X8ZLS7_SALSN|nr:hypothetical protein SASPL_127400 [Salvia splendens]